MKKVVLILLASSAVLLCGIAAAYLNTVSFGYGGARLFEANETKIVIMDNEINFERVKDRLEKGLKNASSLSRPI